MMRDCMINFNGSWADDVPLKESTYNNSNHSNIQKAPFEALYGHRCRYLVVRFEVGEVALIEQDSVHDAMDKFQLIRYILKTT